MGRYRIFDLYALQAFEDSIPHSEYKEEFRKSIQRTIKPFVLTEEETLQKFKEVFSAGDDFSYWMYSERSTNKDACPDWEEYSKTL